MRRQLATVAIVMALVVIQLFPLGLIALKENGRVFHDFDRRRPSDFEGGLSPEQAEVYDPTLDYWQHEISTTHFSLHYNTTNGNATTHDYAQKTLESLSYSWTIEVDSFNFRPPPDNSMDVYLLNLPDYGWSVPAWNVWNGWHVGYIAIDIGIPTAGLLNVTCAHEFFHTVMYSYLPVPTSFPADPPPNAFEEDWIAEGIPTWIESKVYPDYVGVGSYIAAVNNYMSDPSRAITQLSYYAALYWIFIDEHHGGINTIRNVLEQTTDRDSIYAVNATLNTKGTTFSRVFVEWTTANYLKDSYYTKGALFQSISTVPGVTLPYDGSEHIFHPEVSDWAADYFEIVSSVIFMPMEFLGEESHNVTKIFIEHGIPIVSRFELNATYDGVFNLTQANNLDKVIIIIRSLGTENSNNVVSYYLKFLGSAYVLEGPKQLTSSSAVLAVVKTTSHQVSAFTVISVSGNLSSQGSSTSTVTVTGDSSTQSSSPEITTVVGKSSSQSSSPVGPLNVRMKGDVNGDGTVNEIDLESLSRAYGSTPQSSNWNPSCDFNDDSKIDIIDLNLLGENYGNTVP